MQTVLCPRCSKVVPSAAAFCRRCGQEQRPLAERVQSSFAGVPADAPWRPAPARPGPRVVLAIALVIGAALAVLVGLPAVRSRSAAPLPAVEQPAFDQADHRRTRADLVAAPLPPLPPLPAFRRHLPADLSPKGSVPAELDRRGQLLTQDRYGAGRLSGAIFAGTHLVQVTFEKADLRKADFRGAEFLQTTLAGADLEGARFDGASFHQSRFTSVDTAAVSGQTRVRDGIAEPIPPPPLPARNAGKASFRGARFSHTDLGGLDLSGADFREAEFSGGAFRDADLSGADFRDSRHRANDFRGARLDGADLRGADLTFARNLTDAQLATAHTDGTTRRPRR